MDFTFQCPVMNLRKSKFRLPPKRIWPGARSCGRTVSSRISSKLTILRTDRILLTRSRSCNKKGLAPRPLNDIEPDTGQRQILFRKLSPNLVLFVKAHDLITRCSTAMTEFGVRVMSREQEKSLDVLLRSLESQVSGLETETASGDASSPIQFGAN